MRGFRWTQISKAGERETRDRRTDANAAANAEDWYERRKATFTESQEADSVSYSSAAEDLQQIICEVTLLLSRTFAGKSRDDCSGSHSDHCLRDRMTIGARAGWPRGARLMIEITVPRYNYK
jgi:hypothetical protein